MPRRLWDYALVWCTEIFSRTYNYKTERTGLEHLTRDMPDISEWLDFDLFDKVWFWDSPHKEENLRPGRWLAYLIKSDQLSVTGSLIIREMSSLALLCSM